MGNHLGIYHEQPRPDHNHHLGSPRTRLVVRIQHHVFRQRHLLCYIRVSKFQTVPRRPRHWQDDLQSWAQNILRHSPEQRAFTLVMMNAICQSTTAWTLILTFPTVEAPRFTKGYSFVVACAIMLIVMTWVVKYLHDKQE